MDTITLDIKDGIARVTLNRPDVLNAFNQDMIDELWSIVPQLDDIAVRAVVFTGEGRAFSAGADVKVFHRWATNGEPTTTFRLFVRRLHDFFDHCERLEKPVIAAINGVCAGGGLELALSCDLRIAKAGARFGFPEHRLGLIPNSGGCSRTARLVGPGIAKDLIFTGDLIDADRALEIRLVERVYPEDAFEKEVDALVASIAEKPAQALGLAKYAIDNAADTDRSTGRYIERLCQSILLRTSDHAEGLNAFLDKRPPNFTGE